MKIVAPSYAILDDLDKQSLAYRIEYCGRVCYKSEDKIDRESAIPFVRKMAEHGHNSVLEMGVVTLRIRCGNRTPIDDFFLLQPKFFQTDRETENELLLTGSIRAFRELLILHPQSSLAGACAAFLGKRHPYFFEGLVLPTKAADTSVDIEKIALEEIDKFDPEKLYRHRHMAVKFIVNRAVTHEIVRHRPCSFLQESQRYCRYADNKFGGEVTFIKPMFFAEDSREYELWLQAMQETEKLYLQLLETSSPQAARTVLPNSCKTELIVFANLAEWQHIFNLRTTKAAEPSMREVMIPLHHEFKARFPDVIR